MACKRRWSSFKRFFRHRTIVILIFVVCMIFFMLAVAYNQGKINEVNRINFENDLKRRRSMLGRGDRINLEYSDQAGKQIAGYGAAKNSHELPGEADPDSIFISNTLGNFEAKEPQQQPGMHGEMGKPVYVESNQEAENSKREYGFNTYVSDMISMNRSIPDVRMDECKYWHYAESLPDASVVIAFHNEGWSPLLRTVHSVLLRSPPHLIKEIILVDDFSDKEHLKSKLDDYLLQFNGKVKLIRNKERAGLIQTRSTGAQAAKGQVVIFLDAHCEVNINWLPPLLAPIRHDRKVMTVPVIDGIDMNTWAYHRVYGQADRHFRGIFEWGLLYKETEISPEEKRRRKYDSQPFRSPTHAGGLFAIDKKWFEELGYYDPGLQIWGGEQYELSFKIWQCGGGILFVPCSHVGHVYRSHMPYGFGKLSGKPIISTNMLRVVKTWMDEYDKYYFIREPSAQKRVPGNITSQIELRKRLNCKSFDWYMKNVAYDVIKSYPFLPENQVWGEARNPGTGKCIDANNAHSGVRTMQCHGGGGSQLLRLNVKGQLTQGEWCITAQGDTFNVGYCPKGSVNGPFHYNEKTRQIQLPIRRLCVTLNHSQSSKSLFMKPCEIDNPNQVWEWREIFID